MTRHVVVGASCSGKSTYTWDERGDDDLVADFDRIAEALGNSQPHDATGLIGEATFRARLSVIGTALESDDSSWIIHGNPSAEQIADYMAADAEFIVLDPGLDECLARAEADNRPADTADNIRAWYDNPPVFPDDATVTTITDTPEDQMKNNTRALAAASGPHQRGANRYWGTTTPPKSKTDFFNVVTVPAAAEDSAVATVRMYGPIDSWGGWWGISAEEVSDVLDALPESVEHIILRINSPGGEVWEAMAILNMFRAHKAKVTAVVDGIAASAGSFLAVGCDETIMSPGTQMMIHSPLTWDYGNAADLRKTADVLDSVEESIITIYRDKAGQSAWGELLAAETWYTAAEAVTAGLADRVAVVKDAGATSTPGNEDPEMLDPIEGDSVDDKYRAARARLGRAPRGAMSLPPKLPSSSEPGDPNRKENVVENGAFVAGIRERLGVTDADASPETVLAALDEALAEQPTTPAASAVTVLDSLPAGTQVIENTVLATLQSDAAAGRQARDQQIHDRREGIIRDALREGRISAASAADFRAMLDVDEARATAVLASLATNTAVAVEEVGHSDTLTSADDSLYGSIYPAEKEA